MRIKLDRTLCDGFGMCGVHAPAVFSIDEWGYASLAGTGEVNAQDEQAVKRAVLDCPVHAISELTRFDSPASGRAARPR